MNDTKKLAEDLAAKLAEDLAADESWDAIKDHLRDAYPQTIYKWGFALGIEWLKGEQEQKTKKLADLLCQDPTGMSSSPGGHYLDATNNDKAPIHAAYDPNNKGSG